MDQLVPEQVIDESALDEEERKICQTLNCSLRTFLVVKNILLRTFLKTKSKDFVEKIKLKIDARVTESVMELLVKRKMIV